MYHIDSSKVKPNNDKLLESMQSMMKRGVRLHRLDSMYSQYNAAALRWATVMNSDYGISNPNSSQQVTRFMSSLHSPQVYDIANIDGKWTSNKDVLTQLADMGYEWARVILAYRKAKKYGDSIKALREAADSNQIIHPIVSLSKTNRINYSSPALMNIPKSILWNTIAPMGEGNVLISADIKNQEPSILINMTKANELKDALYSEKGLYEELFDKAFTVKATMNLILTNKNPSRYIPNSEMSGYGDVPPVMYTPTKPLIKECYLYGYRITAIDIVNFMYNRTTDNKLPETVAIEVDNTDEPDNDIFKCKVHWMMTDEVKKKIESGKTNTVEVQGIIEGVELRCVGQTRKEFKTAWNAMTYGAGIMGVRAACKEIDADTFFKFFNGIEALAKYRAMCNNKASNGITTATTHFGTQLEAGYGETKNRLKRILMDLPIQGTAADILAIMVEHINNEISLRGLTGKLFIYFTRHDEIVFEASKDWVNEVGIDGVIAEIRDIAEHQVDDWTPFKMEVDIVNSDDTSDEDDED